MEFCDPSTIKISGLGFLAVRTSGELKQNLIGVGIFCGNTGHYEPDPRKTTNP